MTSCTHACVYRRTSMTSAHFPMLIFKWYFTREWTMQTTAHYTTKEKECVCVYICEYETRKQNRRRRNTKTLVIWWGEGRATRRELEVRQRWPEFHRSGKSVGKIHGSLCAARQFDKLCVSTKPTSPVRTYPTRRVFFSSDFIAVERLARNLSAKSKEATYTRHTFLMPRVDKKKCYFLRRYTFHEYGRVWSRVPQKFSTAFNQ